MRLRAACWTSPSELCDSANNHGFFFLYLVILGHVMRARLSKHTHAREKYNQKD